MMLHVTPSQNPPDIASAGHLCCRWRCQALPAHAAAPVHAARKRRQLHHAPVHHSHDTRLRQAAQHVTPRCCTISALQGAAFSLNLDKGSLDGSSESSKPAPSDDFTKTPQAVALELICRWAAAQLGASMTCLQAACKVLAQARLDLAEQWPLLMHSSGNVGDAVEQG